MRSLYERHAVAADRGAWSVERDIAWSDIDPAAAHAQPEILDQLRSAALIESFHPVNLGGLLRLAWDDVDACVAFSLEGYEGFKHFHALRKYLRAVGHEPAITDEEIVGIRAAAAAAEDPADLVEQLVDFMLSEHLAYYFFRRLAEQAQEPVLVELLGLIAADEVRHAQSASDLIAKRIAADPGIATRVLDAAVHFRHFGEQAVGEVPVAMPGDPLAIRTFARRIERLCGVRLVDHLKGTLERSSTTEILPPPARIRKAGVMEISEQELDYLNFYRASELHGGLILGHMVARTRDPRLALELTRHSAEEVVHARLWTETIIAVGGRPRPVHTTYQKRYAALVGRPSGMLHVLAATQVFERRVYRHFLEHLRRPGTHPAIQATLRRMIEEEKGHLSWVKEWLAEQALTRPDEVRDIMQRFTEADAEVYRSFLLDYGWRKAA